MANELTQKAASVFGVTLTGNASVDNDAIASALHGADEAHKDAFYAIRYGGDQFANGLQQITTVLDGSNHAVPVSSLGTPEQDYYHGLNVDHAKSLVEYENIVANIAGGVAPFAEHVVTAANDYVSTDGSSGFVDQGDTSGSGGGAGGGGGGGGGGDNTPTPRFTIPTRGRDTNGPDIPDFGGSGRPVSIAPDISNTGGGGSGGGSGSGGSGSGSGSSGGSSGGSSTDGSSGSTTTSDPINRLIDLVASQYAGAGSGAGAGGIVALPTGIDSTGTTTTTSKVPLIIVALVVVGAIWWYKSHHKKAA